MIVYILLLLPVAAIAYFFGSLSTLVIASNFIFHRNLRKLGKGNVFISNFKRIYGIKGAVALLLVEAVKDILPVLIGGLVLLIKGHLEAGRAFALFCMVLGRLWPYIYRMKGSHGTLTLAFGAILLEPSLGIAALAVSAAVAWFSKYVSLGTVAGALVVMMFSLLTLEDRLLILLVVFTGLAVIIKHIPAMARMINGQEEKLELKMQDLRYKFDEKF